MGVNNKGKGGQKGARLMENHSVAHSQYHFFFSLPILFCSQPLSCLPAWLDNWISVVSQGSALLELCGRSEVAGHNCVTANLSLDSSGYVRRKGV